jgi:ketosteroid isomerase-like protein
VSTEENVARGKVKATGKTFEDHWVFANIREYVDTQALARASGKGARHMP